MATNQSYTGTIGENYAVEITMGSCTDTSVCNAIVVVGIEETMIKNTSIYPNPTNGVVVIDLGDNMDEHSYTVATIEGRIIQSNKTNESQFEVDLTSESKGVYFLKIQEGNTSITYKIIKQ